MIYSGDILINMITIFTDGSARGNPGPGGWGVVYADEEKVVELGGGDVYTTNNRMELTAAIRALEFISPQQLNIEKTDIVLYTDSEYVLKGITVWVHNWQKNNWRTAARKPVENQDLWQALMAAAEGKAIDWKLVRGHAGVPANERCDTIATSFADTAGMLLYNGPKHEYTISLRPVPGHY